MFWKLRGFLISLYNIRIINIITPLKIYSGHLQSRIELRAYCNIKHCYEVFQLKHLSQMFHYLQSTLSDPSPLAIIVEWKWQIFSLNISLNFICIIYNHNLKSCFLYEFVFKFIVLVIFKIKILNNNIVQYNNIISKIKCWNNILISYYKLYTERIWHWRLLIFNFY